MTGQTHLNIDEPESELNTPGLKPHKALRKLNLINITLPDETIELIDQVIEKGDFSEETLRDRSQFINEAVQYYIAQKALINLREQLKEGAIQRAKRDLELVKL
ncbi:ribbon-helix-helix domain-containing protein [Nostoc sp.]|uniref:ribbon-helix-helix domain-containing protein n=1 Tax=Nostoc sp. TaxID=1180 RepID=UPI002FF9104C